QADVDAKSVKNTATVASTNPQGTAVRATSDQVTVPTGTGTPGLSLTKSSTVSGTGARNDVVTYTFVAKNTGSLTLTGVTIADPLPNIGTITYSWPQTAGTLSPGQSVTATATYTITQADVDRGYIDNRATASATDSASNPISASSNQNRTPTVDAAPGIQLTKGGAVTSGGGASGATVTWTFSVRNTGNVTLSQVAIADQLAGIGTITFGTWPSGTAQVLRPGDTVSATATYTTTQSDVDAGSVVNTATASGTPPTGAAATSTASATVPLARTALLTLGKTAAVSGSGGVGSTITYTFTARNAGTVTLRGVTINDPLAGLGSISYGTWPSGTVGTLRPGDSIVATATYAVGQADVDRGSVTNQATAGALLPDGSSASATSPQVVTNLQTAAPALTVTKSANPTSGARAGDVIRYTLAIRNSGNVTVTGITATDSLPAVTDVVLTWPGATGQLAPGETATGTASYRVTQADVDTGSVVNTLSATGTGARGGSATGSGSATTTTTIAAPAVAVTDSGALAPGSTGRAGDTVTWSYVVSNPGNVTLTGVAVTEGLNGATAPVYGTWPGGMSGRLAPGQSVTATTTYVLTQADVDAGGVTSSVSTRGTGPSPTNTVVTANSTARVAVASTPSLSPVKTGTIVSPGTGQLGDTIRYTLNVTNTGNVTLYRGALVDPLPGLQITSIDWPDNSKPGTLP
ncbi:MAG: DUF11 domain-containing protein, partial [Williamsia herbipolensis]|nr:DUF11 domain-containing protein [Williamsia herbipolensis]